jgi:subtilisin family serine protease
MRTGCQIWQPVRISGLPLNRVRRQLILPDTAPKGKGVRVAVVDTGIDPAHPDLVGRYNEHASKSFLAINPDLVDRNLHGTHVAGIIGGTGASSNGMNRGIAPECELVIFQIARGKTGLQANAAAAVEAAINAKVDIINYSHGHSPSSNVYPPPWIWSNYRNLLDDAFAAAASAGILCVVSAGNAGPDEGSITRPGGLDCVLTVGAIGLNGQVSEQSSRGPYRELSTLTPNAVERFDAELHKGAQVKRKPDIVAPGEQVLAPRSNAALDVTGVTLNESGEFTDPNLDDPYYVSLTGTSQATAVVSGLAACVVDLARQNRIDLGPNQGQTLQRLFTRAAVELKTGSSADYGFGTVKWPWLIATLEDFVRDPGFRDIILNGPTLKLI